MQLRGFQNSCFWKLTLFSVVILSYNQERAFCELVDVRLVCFVSLFSKQFVTHRRRLFSLGTWQFVSVSNSLLTFAFLIARNLQNVVVICPFSVTLASFFRNPVNSTSKPLGEFIPDLNYSKLVVFWLLCLGQFGVLLRRGIRFWWKETRFHLHWNHHLGRACLDVDFDIAVLSEFCQMHAVKWMMPGNLLSEKVQMDFLSNFWTIGPVLWTRSTFLVSIALKNVPLLEVDKRCECKASCDKVSHVGSTGLQGTKALTWEEKQNKQRLSIYLSPTMQKEKKRLFPNTQKKSQWNEFFEVVEAPRRKWLCYKLVLLLQMKIIFTCNFLLWKELFAEVGYSRTISS